MYPLLKKKLIRKKPKLREIYSVLFGSDSDVIYLKWNRIYQERLAALQGSTRTLVQNPQCPPQMENAFKDLNQALQEAGTRLFANPGKESADWFNTTCLDALKTIEINLNNIPDFPGEAVKPLNESIASMRAFARYIPDMIATVKSAYGYAKVLFPKAANPAEQAPEMLQQFVL